MADIEQFEKFLKGAHDHYVEFDFLYKENMELAKQVSAANQNINRFIKALDKIAKELNIEWHDGDFPIDEAMEKLKNAGR